MIFTPSKTLPPITFDADPENYHAVGRDIPRGNPHKVMSRGSLVEFGRCPAKWLLGSEMTEDGEEADDATKAMKWGALMDCLILQPEAFANRYAVAPLAYPCDPTKKDPRTEKPWNWNANYCAQWRDDQEGNGVEVLKATGKWQAADSERAEAAFERDRLAVEFVAGCQKQVQVIADYTDPSTGMSFPVKGLIDLVPKSHELADLKTTKDASPDAFDRQIASDKLHIQSALYLTLFNTVTGEKRECFRHVIQENVWPFMTARRWLDEETLQQGKLEYQALLARYCQCLATNCWPDYETEPNMVIDGWGKAGLPFYAYKQ